MNPSGQDSGDQATAEREQALAELSAAVAEIARRVRADYDSLPEEGMAVPDLTPLLEARDAAWGKVAAIGTVNPRPPGLLNHSIQAVKKTVARLLNWHVREQIEFNRATIAGMEATLEALNQINQALKLAARRSAFAAARAQEYADLKAHWEQWRREWETKLEALEVRLLRSLGSLQGGLERRFELLEGDLRRKLEAELATLRAAVDTRSAETAEEERRRADQRFHDFQTRIGRDIETFQQRIWTDLARSRREWEQLIHTELRTLRQRLAALPWAPPATSTPPAPESGPPAAPLDLLRFAERFRGSEDDIRNRLRFYLPYFRQRSRIVDLGCGRGEFLEVLREAGVSATGVDSAVDCVALCQAKGLTAQQSDIFAYLSAQPDASLDGVFCAQVIEHLPPLSIPALVSLCAAKLAPGGLLVVETPNPECLAILATHFYLDPTHVRPVPARLMAFYLEEAGFGEITVTTLHPAESDLPALSALPEPLRAQLFGGMDYAIFATRLG